MEDLTAYSNFINNHKRKFDELNQNNNVNNNLTETQNPIVVQQVNQQEQQQEQNTINIPTTTTTTSPPLSTESIPPTKPIRQDILTLPYNLSQLNWDINHLENKEKCYCYCGKDKENIMINCDICKQRFHLRCIRLLDGSVQLYGDWVYRFSCSVCTKGNESFERFSKNYVDILEITLFNLQFRKEEKQLLFSDSSKMLVDDEKSKFGWGTSYFSLDDDILPFIDTNWHLFCSDKKKKLHWQKPLQQALQSGKIFKSGQINIGKSGYYALGTDILLLKDNSIFKDKVLAQLPKKNKKKKKTQQDIQQEERDKYLTVILLTPNKAENYIPGIEYDRLCVAKQNSAPQVRILDDLLSVRNDKGYRTARTSFPVVTGEWYFEIELLDDVGNVRLGWSTFRSDIQANVGYDQFGYSYRNSQGDIFHKAISKPYHEPYCSKDVIGFYIKLPVLPNVTTSEEINFPFINQISIIDMFLNEQQQETQNYPTLGEDSQIRFYKNGVSPGVAFSNLSKGMYYPSASLYLGAGVKFNFGPNFKFPPKDLSYKPYCDLIKKSNN